MRRKTILVVDDEPIITTTLVLILNRRWGREFTAIGTNNITEALALIREVQPELVLLDVFMPGICGLQHAHRIRDEYGCKILLMSGHGEAGTLLEEEAKRNDGVQPFEIIAKPFQPTQLLDKLREVLVSSSAANV